MVVGLVTVKFLILYGITALFRMDGGDRLLLAILLSQAGEFAFVIFQFARTAGGFSGDIVNEWRMQSFPAGDHQPTGRTPSRRSFPRRLPAHDRSARLTAGCVWGRTCGLVAREQVIGRTN